MYATFLVLNLRYRNHAEYFRHGIDIVPVIHSPSTTVNRFYPYPLLTLKQNIIVPEAEPYSGFYVYLLVLTTNEIFGYCAGAIVSTVFMLILCRYIEQKKIFLFQSFRDVVKLLVNDNGTIKYQKLSCSETFIIGPLTFVGFVVVNGYLSGLQSHLTKPALQPQLRTVEDIYNSPLSIATPLTLVNEVLRTVSYRSAHENWNKKIVGIDNDIIRYQPFDFNTSTIYTMNNFDFHMLTRIQRQLNRRGFYNTDVTVLNSLSTFPVLRTVVFLDKLNEIFLRIQSSGLFYQWMDEHLSQKVKTILAKYDRPTSQEPAADEFEFPMLVIYGWIVSTFVLIVEIVWSKVKRNCFSVRF